MVRLDGRKRNLENTREKPVDLVTLDEEEEKETLQAIPTVSEGGQPL
jgi:hypothetical protein